MANVIFSSVVSDMVSRAISLLTSQLRNQRSTEAKLRTLHHMVIKIQSVVEEAEERQITSHGLLSWLSELINGAYQGSYMLDIFRYGVTESALFHGDGDHEFDSQSSLSSLNPAKRLRVAVNSTKTMWLGNNDVSELDRVLENLQLVCENLKEFIMLLGSKPPLVHRPITTTLYVDNKMFGRHVERERIINFLLSEQNEPAFSKELSILPVIGHTGVGKDTLVQHVCVDPRVCNYFSLVLLFDTYFTHSMGNTSLWNYDDPAQLLNDKVHGRRFLIVFQDLGFHHMQKLKMILLGLRSGVHGSKIILTSNNKHVASIGTVKPIILHVLPPAEYWFFFKVHAFESTDLEQDQRLMAIRRIIARRLKGSFLGAKIVGGLLKANPNPMFWWTVANCGAWNLLFHGDGLGYIKELASHLLLPLVKKHRLAMTSSLTTDCRSQLQVKNSCPGADPVDTPDRDKYQDSRNSPEFDVLLCKSLFPFYSLYLIAHCARD